MSLKGIRFNGETISGVMPTEYIKNVNVDGASITFTNADGNVLTYEGSSASLDDVKPYLDNNYLSFTNEEQSLTEYQKALVRSKIGAGDASFSGNYDDLINKPTIPTATSQLINDSGFITINDVPSGGGGGSIENAVTIDTDQTITGTKTFESLVLTGNNQKSIGITDTPLNIKNSSMMRATIFGAGITSISHDATLFGSGTKGQYQATAVGSGAQGGSDYSVALGHSAKATGYRSSALGAQSTASANNCMQLGKGTNSTEGTLQFMEFTLLDASGKIPNARLSAPIPSITTTLLDDGTYSLSITTTEG